MIWASGFPLGVGERHVRVAWKDLRISDNGEKIVINATKDELKGWRPIPIATKDARRVFSETGVYAPAADCLARCRRGIEGAGDGVEARAPCAAPSVGLPWDRGVLPAVWSCRRSRAAASPCRRSAPPQGLAAKKEEGPPKACDPWAALRDRRNSWCKFVREYPSRPDRHFSRWPHRARPFDPP